MPRWPDQRKPPGIRPKLNPDQRRDLASMVESGPIPATHGVVRWRRRDLARWIFEEFRLIEQPWIVMSIALRDWVHGS